MALRDQLLGLGSSIYNFAGAPFGGAGALQLGQGLMSGGLGNIAGGLSSLGSGISSLSMPAAGSSITGGLSMPVMPAMSMPGLAVGALGLPGLLGGLFGGMTSAENRMNEVKDVMADRSRFQEIAKDPGGWLAQQTASGNSAIPSDVLGAIDRGALSGKLTVPNFQNMLLGPENQTPELQEALTGLMFGGAQQNIGSPWHPTVNDRGFPWGKLGSEGAMGESGHRVPDIPGWPAGMINPLETDIPINHYRPREVGMMGDWMNRLYAQIHDPNYSLGLSTGGPAGLLADFQRIGPDVRDEGE